MTYKIESYLKINQVQKWVHIISASPNLPINGHFPTFCQESPKLQRRVQLLPPLFIKNPPEALQDGRSEGFFTVHLHVVCFSFLVINRQI
ncbi:hypothetical protein D7V86_25355 [bacterium D16-51]|nr:hypothetical protein D7V96_24875 [bacterium D16-59]RKI53129.1 hypothetical protein D7V86_25355 [bacterium D16-51]